MPGVRMRGRRAIVGLVLFVGLASVAVAEAGGRAPKLVQLSYEESNDGSSPPKALSAFFRRAEAVKFVTRHDGARARGDSRYNQSITDTDLHGEASHPWRLIRRGGGKRVLRLIHRSLVDTGEAKVRVIARGNGRRTVDKVLITLADCAQDPPLYPVSCEVRP
jgi:hypothetical protein